MHPQVSEAPPTGDEVDIDAIMAKVTIVLSSLTVVLGLSGNALVIYTAAFRLQPTVTNVWLVNLAAADLVFCASRIFSLVKRVFFDYWPFGLFLCQLTGSAKYANMFCSVFLLAVISVDRALCVRRPVFTRRRRTLRAAHLVAACVWAASLGLSLPFFFHRTVSVDKNNLSRCSLHKKAAAENLNATEVTLYALLFFCGFLLPFVVILTCNILTGVGIRRTRLSGKSRPLRVLVALVVAFFLCWAPYHCLRLVKMVHSQSVLLKIWYPVAKGVAYFNSCVNPMLYFCMGLLVRGRGQCSLTAIYQRALADDGDAPAESNERSLDDSSSATTGRSQTAVGVAKV